MWASYRRSSTKFQDNEENENENKNTENEEELIPSPLKAKRNRRNRIAELSAQNSTLNTVTGNQEPSPIKNTLSRRQVSSPTRRITSPVRVRINTSPLKEETSQQETIVSKEKEEYTPRTRRLRRPVSPTKIPIEETTNTIEELPSRRRNTIEQKLLEESPQSSRKNVKSIEENKTTNQELNLSLLPDVILFKIAKFLGFKDVKSLSSTFKYAGIIRKLPLDLSDINLEIKDIWHYFGKQIWNITGLNVTISKSFYEEKAVSNLPDYIYPILKTLKLNITASIKDINLEWLSQCTVLNKFRIRGPFERSSKSSVNILAPLANCKMLTSFRASAEPYGDLIPLIAKFPNLRKLTYTRSSVFNLDFLKNNRHLTSLNLEGAISLLRIDGLAFCPNLQKLNLSSSGDIQDLSPIENALNLRELSLNLLGTINIYLNMSSLTNLTSLKLHDIISLKWNSDIPSLTSLALFNSREIDFDDLIHFPNLINLTIHSSQNTDLLGIEICTKLVSLKIRSCGELENIDDLNCRDTLKELAIEHCDVLNNLDILKSYQLTKVKLINLPTLSSNNSLDFLSQTTTLEELFLEKINISNIDGIDLNNNLKILKIDYCSKLTNLDGISNCTNLESISVHECDHLERIPSLKRMNKLTKLNIAGSDLIDYNFLNEQPSLKDLRLIIGREISLDNFVVLNTITTLETLYISGGTGESFPFSNKLVNLSDVSISFNRTLNDVATLGYLPRLKSLKLNSLNKLYEIAEIATCTNLERLEISECPDLISLDGLENCTNLFSLKISRCYKLQDNYVLDSLADNLQEVEIESTSILTDKKKRESFKAKHKNWKIGYYLSGSSVGPKISYES